VGLRLWEIAALAPRGLALRQLALPYLEDLYESTHENVQLAVRDGTEVVYTEWISGRSAVGVHIRVGARWPLHATGVGLALLAHDDPIPKRPTARVRWRPSRRTRSPIRYGCAGCWPKSGAPASR
jgi:DNA-binding IclR family transcriptional regulator